MEDRRINKNEVVTSDLSRFGHRELKMAAELLTAMTQDGVPDDFLDDEVTVAMNTNSCCVFLTNSEFQVAMMNGDKLESWYSCPECGHEGFKEDMKHERSGDCLKYLRELGLQEAANAQD